MAGASDPQARDRIRASRQVAAVWSVHIEPGIDSGRTKARFVGVIERGRTYGDGMIAVTPRDQYGSLVGPGRADRFKITGGHDTTVTGPVRDELDGTYLVPVQWRSSARPALVIAQPDRDPVVVGPIAPSGGRRAPSPTKRAPRKRR